MSVLSVSFFFFIAWTVCFAILEVCQNIYLAHLVSGQFDVLTVFLALWMFYIGGCLDILSSCIHYLPGNLSSYVGYLYRCLKNLFGCYSVFGYLDWRLQCLFGYLHWLLQCVFGYLHWLLYCLSGPSGRSVWHFRLHLWMPRLLSGWPI